MKIKISERATHSRNELLLLQNVSARVWENLVAFSSVVIRQDFFLVLYAAGGGRSRTAQSGRPRPLWGLMGLSFRTIVLKTLLSICITNKNVA